MSEKELNQTRKSALNSENAEKGENAEKKLHYGKELISRSPAIKIHDVICFGRSANMPPLRLTLIKESVTCDLCDARLMAGEDI